MVLTIEYHTHQEKLYGSRKSLIKKLNTIIEKDIDYRYHTLAYTNSEKRELQRLNRMDNLFS